MKNIMSKIRAKIMQNIREIFINISIYKSKMHRLSLSIIAFVFAITLGVTNSVWAGDLGVRMKLNPKSEEAMIDPEFAKLDIGMRYDGVNTDPHMGLAVAKVPNLSGADELVFSGYWNFNDFVDSAEVRIFRSGENTKQKPLAKVPLNIGSYAKIAIDPDWISEYGEVDCVLRVYAKNDKSKFNETKPIKAYVDGSKSEKVFESPEKALEQGYRQAMEVNNILIDNIDLPHAAIRYDLRNLPKNYFVTINGVMVPSYDKYITQKHIIPIGNHDVEVKVYNMDTKRSLSFKRRVYVPVNDFFYVALADLTIGSSGNRDLAGLVDDGRIYKDQVYYEGRVAGYLRGMVQGKYLITALLDTEEEDLDDILRNIDRKDPRSVLRRLDPDRFYPIYGDESDFDEHAPTQGNLYLKVEKHNSHVMWGNFNTELRENDLAQVDRSLYGARMRYRSNDVTSHGEARNALDVFVAEPETLQVQDNFSGTGGSLYFLRFQDISQGSEKVRVEIRDRDTGIVRSTQYLRYKYDYDIDYIQGRIVLTRPLSAIRKLDAVVRRDALDGDAQYLVVTYECSPGMDLDNLNFGGRVSRWLGDTMRVGVTAANEEVDGGIDKKVIAGDVVLRYKPGTYFKAQMARTEGNMVGGGKTSLDGGFNFFSDNPSDFMVADASSALGYMLEANVRAEDLGYTEKEKSFARVYYRDREAGFSSLGQFTDRDINNWGGEFMYEINKKLSLRADYNDTIRKDLDGRRNASADITYSVKEDLDVAIGGRYRDKRDHSIECRDTEKDERVDIGMEITKHTKGGKVYGFAQTDLNKDREFKHNRRGGVGAEHDVSYILRKLGFNNVAGYNENGEIDVEADGSSLTIVGEVSGGNGGIGSSIGLNLARKLGSEYYVNYVIGDDNVYSDSNFSSTVNYRNRGQVVMGGRERFNEYISVYGEEKYLHQSSNWIGNLHSYGADIKLGEYWSVGTKLEAGVIEEIDRDRIDRNALSILFSYVNGGRKFSVKGEGRRDESEANGNNKTFLGSVRFEDKLNPDLTLLAKLQGATSSGNRGRAYEGEYFEGILGLAYRPVVDNRFNSLMRYSFYYDLATPSQQIKTISGAGPVLPVDSSATFRNIDYRQRSHIVSLDFDYKLNKRYTVGAKYGLKVGEVTTARDTDDWTRSDAHLGVLRLDYHVVKNWDLLIEGRGLWLEQIKQDEYGVLAALYRHFGDHMKLGLGYNFTSFDDDLTKIDFDSEGWFFNAIAKF